MFDAGVKGLTTSARAPRLYVSRSLTVFTVGAFARPRFLLVARARGPTTAQSTGESLLPVPSTWLRVTGVSECNISRVVRGRRASRNG